MLGEPLMGNLQPTEAFQTGYPLDYYQPPVPIRLVAQFTVHNITNNSGPIAYFSQ